MKKELVTLENLKDGDKVWLKEDCKSAHPFWSYDMLQNQIVTLKNYNGQAFNTEEAEKGLYPVQLIDLEKTNQIIKKREVKQYIIVRTDLDVCCGKLIAQACHAATNIFFDKFEPTQVCLKTDGELVDGFVYIPSPEEMHWLKDGRRTKIVKKVKNETQLLKVYEQAKEAGLSTTLIKDAGIFGLEGENFTAVAVGPNYEDECDPVLRKLRLLKDLKTNEG